MASEVGTLEVCHDVNWPVWLESPDEEHTYIYSVLFTNMLKLLAIYGVKSKRSVRW
jgi:hypothetical protein